MMPWLGLLILLISGCAVTQVSKSPVADVEQAWLAHQASLTNLTSWTSSGRIVGRTEEQGWSASFQWLQQGDEYHLSLTGPLGQGRVQLDGNALGVSMQLPDQQIITATDPADLLYQRTGWRLPVAALNFWLRGLPAPTSFNKRLDDQGRLAALNQLDWQLDYGLYSNVESLDLPAKVTLKHDDIRVRIVVDTWQIDRHLQAE